MFWADKQAPLVFSFLACISEVIMMPTQGSISDIFQGKTDLVNDVNVTQRRCHIALQDVSKVFEIAKVLFEI